MTDETKPALTPDEWGTKQFLEGEIAVEIRNADLLIQDCAIGAREGIVRTNSPTIRHAAAAFALYRQPGGFTWEMYDALKELLEEHEGDSFHPLSDKKMALARTAIGNMRALLPSRVQEMVDNSDISVTITVDR